MDPAGCGRRPRRWCTRTGPRTRVQWRWPRGWRLPCGASCGDGGIALGCGVAGDVGFEVGELDDERRLPELVDFRTDDDVVGLDVLDVLGPELVGSDVGGD